MKSGSWSSYVSAGALGPQDPDDEEPARSIEEEVKPMTSEDWKKFFELLDRIVSGPGTWENKRNELQNHASDADWFNVEELSSWPGIHD